jgi:group I intron endonuclease
MKNPGIYKITNVTNNKCYIGSAVNVYNRLGDHRKELRKDRHCNKHFQNSWNKYGEENLLKNNVKDYL